MLVEAPDLPEGWRPITDEEMPNLRPAKVMDEMGVPKEVRWTLKNFARNPDMAANYLRSLGYQTVQYGSGLNFAVRKADGDPWRVVDPAGGGIAEFYKDIVDLGSDLFSGAAVGIGIGAGGAVGGALAAGGSELLRQAVGEHLGIEGNLAPLSVETGLQTSVGALGPAIGKAAGLAGRAIAAPVRATARIVGKAGRVFAEGAEELLGRVADVKPLAPLKDVIGGRDLQLGIADTFFQRGSQRMADGSLEALRTPAQVVAIMRSVIDHISGRKGVIGNLHRESQSLLNSAAKEGRKFNFTKFVRELGVLDEEDVFRIDALDASREGKFLKSGIKSLLARPKRSAMLADHGDGGTYATKAHAEVAYRKALAAWKGTVENGDPKLAGRINKYVQDAISEGRIVRGTAEAGGRAAGGDLRRQQLLLGLQGRLRVSLRTQMGGTNSRFAQVMDEMSRKIDARDALRERIGTNVKSAEGFVSNVLKSLKSDERAALVNFDKVFRDEGFGFAKLVHEAGLGLQFTPGVFPPTAFGQPRVFPRLTPQGAVLGPSIFGGILGFAGGGPVGGLIGLGIGASMASPRAIVRMAPMGRIVIDGLSTATTRASNFSLPPTVSRAAQIAAIPTLQAIARRDFGRAVAREDPGRPISRPRKRKTSLLP